MVKICCIMNKDELFWTLEEGVTCVGFVSMMPSGPGIITEERIRELTLYAPRDIDTFLLTSLSDPHEIAEQWRFCGITTIQLCQPLSIDCISTLRTLVPEAKIVSVVHIQSETELKRARNLCSVSDAILLDSGNPNGNPPELGGTGRTHSWEISRRIVEELWKSTWLAGGLTTENVQSALNYIRPYGVDVCSGIRTNGHLDRSLLREFLSMIKS